MSSATTRIAVIGAGSLATSIIQGWRRDDAGDLEITTVNRTRASAGRIAAAVGDTLVAALDLERSPDAVERAVAGADIVLLAVKPYLVTGVLPAIAAAIRPGTIVASVAAGIRSETIGAGLPSGTDVVRIMPNTPTAVGRGVTGIVVDPRVGDGQRERVRGLFERVGIVVEVDDDQLDGIVAISGSGPAYVFLLIEKLRAAAIGQGFDEETAGALAQQVFRGAAELLAETGDDPAELRRRVTSPNGTTERAIEVFEGNGIGRIMDDAVAACRRRAVELASG